MMATIKIVESRAFLKRSFIRESEFKCLSTCAGSFAMHHSSIYELNQSSFESTVSGGLVPWCGKNGGKPSADFVRRSVLYTFVLNEARDEFCPCSWAKRVDVVLRSFRLCPATSSLQFYLLSPACNNQRAWIGRLHRAFTTNVYEASDSLTCANVSKLDNARLVTAFFALGDREERHDQNVRVSSKNAIYFTIYSRCKKDIFNIHCCVFKSVSGLNLE